MLFELFFINLKPSHIHMIIYEFVDISCKNIKIHLILTKLYAFVRLSYFDRGEKSLNKNETCLKTGILGYILRLIKIYIRLRYILSSVTI